MEITLGEIRDKYKIFISICNKKLPIALSFAVAKNFEVLEKEAAIIDDSRIKLAKVYADKNDDGTPKENNGSYVITDVNSFKAEIDSYYQTKIDIDICKANIKELDKLEDPRYDTISPAEILALDFMLEGVAEN